PPARRKINIAAATSLELVPVPNEASVHPIATCTIESAPETVRRTEENASTQDWNRSVATEPSACRSIAVGYPVINVAAGSGKASGVLKASPFQSAASPSAVSSRSAIGPYMAAARIAPSPSAAIEVHKTASP